MTDRANVFVKRNVVGFALTGVVGIWLSGCSADSSRFTESAANPFSNPFATASTGAPAPTPGVTSAPLAAPSSNPSYVAAAHTNPVAASASPATAPATTGQIRTSALAPVQGSATGWTAVGGSPIVVAEGENVGVLSGRYGVPVAALLGANGLSSSSQVHGGMRLVVPVYNARGKTADPAPVATARSPRPETEDVAEAPSKSKAAKKHEREMADASESAAKAKAARKVEREAAEAAADDARSNAKAKKKAETVAQQEPAPAQRPNAKTERTEKAKPAVAAAPAATTTVVAKAEAPKPAPKKGAVDTTPTGNVHGAGTPATAPLTGEQADAAGTSPEFRWPARGRIIQGFKSGGNDGINISVPEGTSVRASENGTVAYAGSELKGYGNLVLIRHPNGFVTAYANNGELDVKRGDVVKRGQVIAKSGQSGNVNSPQLHFELRKGSTPVDPTSYLAGL